MADVPLTIVGAGVVGLAIAARLAPRFPGLLVLERHRHIGMETSSRNSEVIHAGLYYPTGSLKARLCVRGAALLYEHCARHAVPHRRISKLVVAVEPSQEAELERIFALGTANGATLSRLTAAQCRALEPAVPATAGLLSPATGIVDSHALLASLLAQAERAGATLVRSGELHAMERDAGAYRLEVQTAAGLETVRSERVVNAAGLDADTVAALTGLDVDAIGYRQRWCKGSYFAVAAGRASTLSRLVYPVPTSVSLGVHAVLSLDGRLRFGPDAEYLPTRTQSYEVPEAKRAAFGAAVRRLVPTIRDEDLTPDLAGLRAKLQGPGEPARDFVIAEESARGLPGLVNLLGIESPGLTSSLAIAELVEELVPA